MRFLVGSTEYKLNFSFFAISTVSMIFMKSNIVLWSVFSSVFHECGHLIFMYIFKNPPCSVELGAFGMRIEKILSGNVSYFQEAVIAAGGIAVNIFVMLISFVCHYIFDNDVFFIQLAFINLFIAMVNSIPIEALDMGKVINYLLLTEFSNQVAFMVTAKISFVTLIILIIAYIIYLLFYGVNFSLTAVIIYLIIINMKRSKINGKQGN